MITASRMNQLCRMALAFGLVLSIVLLPGCDSASTDGLTAGVNVRPVAPSAISDGAHNGTEGFYFLAPMVKNPTYSGAFDGSLSPVVEVCESPACAALHASFSMAEGAGSERVRVSEADEHYVVNWHTDQTGTEVGQTYRVRVSVAGTALGYADIQMAGNGKEAKNTTTDDVIGLVDGRTLPIKFRIEEGAVFVVGSGGGKFTSNDGAVTIEVPQGAVEGDIGIVVTPVTDDLADPDVVPGLAFEFLPSPYSFAEPVILTVVYDPSSLPTGISEDELRLLAFVGDEWVQLPGSSVNVANSTVSGPLDSFSRKAVGRGKVHAIAVSPEEASVDVGGTQQFVATVTNVDGEVMSRNVQWSSSDEAVATVDNNGLATGVALGEAVIEARSGKVSRSAMLTVETLGPVVNRIDVSPATATIDVGATQQFTTTVYDQYNAVMHGQTVTWSSSDINVATVDTDGLATAFNSGDAMIFAAIGNVRGSATLTVRVQSIWQSMGNLASEYVEAVTVYNGEVIAGGFFPTPIGQPTNYIVRWDGIGWTTLGDGINRSARSFAVHNGDLIVGGSFTTAGGQPAGRVARWDGTAWSALNAGFNGDVFALTVFRDELIAAGHFTSADGQPVNYIARWDGSNWQPLGGGVDGGVEALTVYNDELIAGGWFWEAGGQVVSSIARWDGSQWRSMGSGADSGPNAQGDVRALTVVNGELIAGGYFATMDGQAARNIARWDGIAWQPMGTGMNNGIHALTVHNGDLIAGGAFSTAGGQAARNIARWDAKTWTALGAGMNNVVEALASFGEHLIAGGTFTEPATRIARWGAP